MLLSLRDSRPAPFPGASEQQMDCILGPSRTMMDPIDQWENEGGRVPSSNVDRWREWYRSTQPHVSAKASSAANPAMIRFSATDLRACGRCHGPIQLGRSTLLGRLLSYCVAVEHYHCVDASCGWSGMRISSGLSRPLMDRRLR